MSQKIVRSGMQIYCDRKNERREDGRQLVDAVTDPVYVKFYEALEAHRQKAESENKKPRPMFRLEYLHPDAEGNVKSEVLEYGVLCPDQLKLAARFSEQFSPLSPIRGRRKKEDGGTEGAEATEAAAAPSEAPAAPAAAAAE